MGKLGPPNQLLRFKSGSVTVELPAGSDCSISVGAGGNAELRQLDLLRRELKPTENHPYRNVDFSFLLAVFKKPNTLNQYTLSLSLKGKFGIFQPGPYFPIFGVQVTNVDNRHFRNRCSIQRECCSRCSVNMCYISRCAAYNISIDWLDLVRHWGQCFQFAFRQHFLTRQQKLSEHQNN